MRAWFVSLLLAAIVLAGGSASAQDATWNEVRNADALIEAWLYPQAQDAVDALVREAPDHPGTRYVQGKLLHHQGSYDASVEALTAALIDAPVALRPAVEELLTLVEGTRAAVQGFRETTSPDGHFVFSYDPRDEVLIPLAAQTLELAYYEVGYSLGFWPEGPIRVEFFPRARVLAQVSSLPEEAIRTTSTIALCKYNKLMVTSPRGTVRGYGWRDTLAHEYVHLVISQKTGNRVPIWLHEGIAKYMEGRWRGEFHLPLEPSREQLLARRAASNTLVPFAKMSPSIALLPSQEDAAVAYAEVYSLVEFLVQREGRGAVQDLLDRITQGATPEEAIAAMVNERFPTFERRWATWVRNERPRVDAPIDFEDDVQLVGAQEDDGEFAGVSSPAARDHLHLGELLRARGLLPGALQEYRRAEAILGPFHPMVQNGAARVVIEQGNNEAALSALERVGEFFPSFYATSLNRARAFNNLARPADALDALEDALGVNPFDPEIYEELARAYDALGRNTEAQRARENAARVAN